MKKTLAAAAVLLLSLGTRGFAHRLDEYLQATTILVDKDHVQAQIRLTPGVEVLSIVLPNMDTDADGVLSEAEQRAYADQVLRDLSLTIDGDRLPLRLVSSKFARPEEMTEGLGAIQLEFSADVPAHVTNHLTNGDRIRRLTFENHHQGRIAAYLVNSLIPRDPDIRITAQNRNYEQSSYQLDYVQAGVGSGQRSFVWSAGVSKWLGTAALILFAGLGLLTRCWR